jgi:hypothetical protein
LSHNILLLHSPLKSLMKQLHFHHLRQNNFSLSENRV